MAFAASPSCLTDADLDEHYDDAGIFFSRERHPREQYYQERLARRLGPAHNEPQLSALEIIPEDEDAPNHQHVGPAPSTSPSQKLVQQEEQLDPNSLPCRVIDCAAVRPEEQSILSAPPESACMESAGATINSLARARAEGCNQSGPTPDDLGRQPLSQAASPTNPPPCDFSAAHESSVAPEPVEQLSLPFRPVPQAGLTPRNENGQPDIPNSLTSPSTGTVEFEHTMQCEYVSPRKMESDTPLLECSTPSLDDTSSRPQDSDEERPAKKLKPVPETPPAHRRQFALGSTTTGNVPSHRPPTRVLPLSRLPIPEALSAVLNTDSSSCFSTSDDQRRQSFSSPVKSSIPTPHATPRKVPPSPHRVAKTSVYGTPIRPITPRQTPAGPTPGRSLLSKASALGSPTRPTIKYKASPARPTPLPSDFRFVFSTATPMPLSPEKAVTSATNPDTPLVVDVDLLSQMTPKPVASAKPTSGHAGTSSLPASKPTPNTLRFGISSPHKVSSVVAGSVLGSPVRPATLGSQKPFERREVLGAPHLHHPASPSMTKFTEIPSSMKPINVANLPPKVMAPPGAKPTCLPTLKTAKGISKLPRPAHSTSAVSQKNSRLRSNGPSGVTTVNMVHVPQVSLNGSPSMVCFPLREETVPNFAMQAAAAQPPPPRKKIFRPVVPGTLTGWEGKPMATPDLTQGSSAPGPSSSSSPTMRTSLDGIAPEAQDNHLSNESPGTVTGPSESRPTDDSPPPRRSRRLSKEKENGRRPSPGGFEDPATDEHPTSGDTNNPATLSLRIRPRKARTTTSKPTAPEREWQALTLRNTTLNQQPVAQIERRIIRKDCPRPPSPSTKVRNLLLAEEMEKEEKKNERTERARRRGLLEDEMDDEEDEGPADSEMNHFRGAGDEDDNDTPKRRKIDNNGKFSTCEVDAEPLAALQLDGPADDRPVPAIPFTSKEPSPTTSEETREVERLIKPNSKGRYVRWDRKLVVDCEGESNSRPTCEPKGILAKGADAYQLDTRGNVPDADRPLDCLTKDVVVVVKYVYADDPDLEASPEPPPVVIKRSKRKRS
ncbi:hypothetical protein FRB99_005855 [Tulasnella sp. 403]|nr:hypothetical protein FRB99_005855 [Tulasnella sp. 403]